MKQKVYQTIAALASVLLAVNFVFSLAAPALAVSNSDVLWGNSEGKKYVEDNSGLPTDVKDPRQVVVNVIKIALGFLGILAVIIILYAGFKWMTAGGSEENIGEAKKMLIAGLIGLIIILSAYALANFVIESIYNAAVL